MTPIGRGQRQLIIGDRKTGKTAVCVDTILNQRQNWESGDEQKQVRCVYVAIGQKGTTIAAVRRALEEGGAMDYTTIVAAPASDSAGFKWLAPYTGSAIAQHWMYGGKHVLIVFDDLTKQAEAYRAISLLLRRPPGREAYPGDVFYLHSRLLERCAKLSDELGGGSLTGLPIIETKANDISAYIPTNVISITDGQCFLETDLFNQGVRPAINVGVSVSRVGGAAQIKAMKEVAGSLRLDLSQYRELEAFAAFASDLDATSKAQLERGARLVELLKQPQYQPMPVEEQVVSIFLGTGGHLDSVPVEDVRRFETELLDHIRASEEKILATIRDSQKLDDETADALTEVIKKFKKGFAATGGGSVVPDEHVGALAEEDLAKESVKVKKPVVEKKGKEVATDGCHTSRIARADPLGRLDQEDHQGPGVDRDIAHRQGAGSAQAARPYAFEITTMLTTLAAEAALDHPLLVERPEPKRAGVLVVSSDRGLCGAYNASVFRRAEELFSLLRKDGKTPVLYAVGRKALNYYKFRNWDITESWTGFSEQPKYENAAEIASTLVDAFMLGTGDEGDDRSDTEGVDELHIVYTEFKSMLSQSAVAHRIAPMVVEYIEEEPELHTLYSFEPDATTLFGALLPRYLTTRVYAAMLESAASELASRQRAMKSATDNADDLIKALTLEANRERQAQITQEISEIVGGANALADAAT